MQNLTYEQQIFQLIIYNKSFEKDVLKIRKKWKIPIEGFLDNKSYSEWRNEIDELTDEHMRKGGGYSSSPEALYNVDIEKISEQLGNKYSSNVSDHVTGRDKFTWGFLGGTEPTMNQRLYMIRGRKDPAILNIKEGEKMFLFIFNKDTTEAHLKLALKQYKSLIKSKGERRTPLTSFNLYKRIFELTYENKTDKEIAMIIRNERIRKNFTGDDVNKYRAKATKRLPTYKEVL